MTDPATPSLRLPTDSERWRCSRCGNLTRFDVTRSSRVVEYWHFDLPGEPAVETVDVLEQMVERLRCRWCDATDGVELVPRT